MTDYGPGETRFDEICAECREPLVKSKVGKGKRATFHTVCACNPLPAPEPKAVVRKVKNTAAKGKGGEREVCKLAEAIGIDAFRTAGSGAHGSRNNESSQDTDIILRFKNRGGQEVQRLKVESKLKATIPGLKSLRNELSRSDVLRVREDRDTAFWLVPENIMKSLLAWSAEALK